MLLAAVLLAGCGAKHEERPAKEAARPPIRVSIVELKQSGWPEFYEAVGTVRPRASGQVSARIMAYVREVRVRVGDRVKPGQVLVVLDAGDLQSRRRQADAARTEARTAASEADHGVASARAALELAEVTHGRMKNLHDKTSISNQEMDEATARLEMARSSFNMAEARRRTMDAKIALAGEEVAGAEVQVGYSTVTASFAGLVTEKAVEPGNLAVPGTPLMTIEREDGFRLEATVDEANLGAVRRGQKVLVAFDSIQTPLEGAVSEIAPAVDPGSRSFVAKIDLPRTANLRSGMFGRARFVVGERQLLAAPESAVAQRGQMHWVFVADGGLARGRIVTLGQKLRDTVEILSGLSPGEKIIAPLPAELADGARIEVRP